MLLGAVGSVRADDSQGAQGSPQGAQGSVGDLKQLSLEELGSVEVTTVSKEPEEVLQTPAAIYVLTQEDIRRSGASSIPEVLRLVPGVEVARIDSDHWAVGIRGFGSQFSRSLLVLIDGRSVYTPLFAGVYWDVQDTLLEDIDRIEVIRGPGGTIWGANAVNGVINIITKKAKDTHGALATATGGNVDQGIGGFRYGGGNGQTFDYRVFGKATTRGPELHPNGLQFDDWRDQRGGFRTDWSSRGNNTFTLQGDIYRGDDGESTSVGSFSPPSQIILMGNDQVSGGDLQGRWQHTFAGGSDVQIQTYYDRTDRRAPQYEETRNTFDADLMFHNKLPWRQDLLWGAGVRISPGQFTQTVPTLDFTGGHETDNVYSGFVQDGVDIVKNKLSLTVGTKLEHNNFSGFEYEPSARLLWTVNKRASLWAAVTRAVRTPSELDTDLELVDFLGTKGLPYYLEVAGDPTFTSEKLIGYEAGYRSLITSRFYVDVSAFHNDYSDLSSYGTGSAAFPTAPILHVLLIEPYANGIKGTTDGVEIAPTWKPKDWWQLKGSYSYLHMDLSNEPGNTDTATIATDEGSSPHHEAVFQSLLNLPKRFELDLTYRYVSALPGQYPTGLPDQFVRSYSTADSRFSWHFAHDVELALIGQNLFQLSHAEFGGDPGPLVGIKRSAYAKITWTQEQR